MIKRSSLFRKLHVGVAITLAALSASMSPFLSEIVRAAGDGLTATITGTGVNGAFSLGGNSTKYDNSTNPLPIAADGKVSFAMTWAPTGAFVPTICRGYTRSFIANSQGSNTGGLYDGNTTGNGFFDNVSDVPLIATAANPYQVTANLVQVDGQQRQIRIRCEGTVNGVASAYQYVFELWFKLPAGTLGNCTPGNAEVQYNTSQGESIRFVGLLTADTSYGSVDNAKQQICSEDLTPGGTTPPSFCVQRCDSFNPARAFRQSDTSAAWCNQFEASTPDDKEPFSYAFTTSIDSPKVGGNYTITPTATAGDTLNFNLSQSASTSGVWSTYRRDGNQWGSFSNKQNKETGIGSGWAQHNGDYTEDPNWWSEVDTSPKSLISYRPESNCRADTFALNATNSRETVDTGSVANERFGYFGQQYRRDQSAGDAGARLWENGENMLMPFVQVQEPQYSINVGGGTAGVDYVVDTQKIAAGDVKNAVQFITAGTYTVQVTQGSFEAAVSMCQRADNSGSGDFQQAPPLNCGAGATRIQQFRGQKFPAISSTVFTVTVNPAPGPQADFVVNGIHANLANPSNTTTPTVTGSTVSVNVSYTATGVDANSCAATVENPDGKITVDTDPWKTEQTSLPATMATKAVKFSGIDYDETTYATLVLTCKKGAASVVRKVKVNVSRPAAPAANLTLTVDNGAVNVATVAATDATPAATGPGAVTVTGASGTVKVGWTGSSGITTGSCSVPQVANANNPPWNGNQSGLAATSTPRSLSFSGLAAGSSIVLPIQVTCTRLAGGTISALANITVTRSGGTPALKMTISSQDGSTIANPDTDTEGVGTTGYTTDTNPLTIKWSSSNLLADSCEVPPISSLNGSVTNGSVTITGEPWASGATGLAVSNSGSTMTMSGMDVGDATQMTISLTCKTLAGVPITRTAKLSISRSASGGGGGGNGVGQTLNYGSGSKQW